MIFKERPIAPDFMSEKTNTIWGEIENQDKWSKQYAAKLEDTTKKNTFKWAIYHKNPVNKLIEPHLAKMTNNHCAFCDIFPLRQSGATIEHFRPKTKFPYLSHRWENLFYCCHACQQCKGEKFDESLLKPDELGYDFDYYFVFDFRNEAIFIKSNPLRTEYEQKCAVVTIDLYGLNDFDRPEARWRVFHQFQNTNNPIIEDYSYRFLFLW
jgi:uncharacterized protein (TIGR02646 family)